MTKKESNSSSLSPSQARQSQHARAAIGPWDIKMPPVKKHMVAGHLVPALGTTTRLFNQKHRRVAIEILEPQQLWDEQQQQQQHHLKDALPMMTRTWDPDTDTLNDKDEVVLRFFRKVKPKAGSKVDVEAVADDEDGECSDSSICN